MKDYIKNKALEIRPQIEAKVRANIDLRLENSNFNTLNSLHGHIEGNGTIRNSYIIGNVQIADTAVVANCVVDKGVLLIVDDGAIVCDCSFHAYLLGDKLGSSIIHIRKNSTVYAVWASESLDVGENCLMYWCRIHEPSNNYGSEDIPDGVFIGDGSTICLTDIHCYTHMINKTVSVRVGKNAFCWFCMLGAQNCNMDVGDNFLGISYQNISDLLQSDITIPRPDPESDTPEYFVGRSAKTAGIDAYRTDVKVGNNAFAATIIDCLSAFDKQKGLGYVFGDNVMIISARSSYRNGRDNECTPVMAMHHLNCGNNVTICATGDHWYANRATYRNVEVGDNTVLHLQEHTEGATTGLDISIPANSICSL